VYHSIWVLLIRRRMFVRHGGSFPAWPGGNGMAGRPAGSRRQPVFGRLSGSGENWSALTAAGGLACRCDSAGSVGQARRLTGAAAANTRAAQVRVQEASNWKFTASDLTDLLRRLSEREQPAQQANLTTAA
jgi:hypothetical protein